MPSDVQTKAEQIRALRDAKVIPHLQQYAPVWLLDEVLLLRDDAIQFNVAFYHPLYGWVNRRYRFDAYNNVLYHQGQTLLSEEAMLNAIEDKPPYIAAETVNTVDSYGG